MLYFFNDTVLNAAQSNDEFLMLNYYVSFLEYEHFYVAQSKIAFYFLYQNNHYPLARFVITWYLCMFC